MKHLPGHILFVSHSAGRGGAELEFLKILQFFARHKDRYTIYGAFPAGKLAETFRSLCEETILYQGSLPASWRPSSYAGFIWRSLTYLPLLARFIRQKDIELVFVNTSVLPGPLVAGCLLGLPVIFCIRELITPLALRVPLVRLINRCSTRVIVVSKTIEEEYLRICGARDKTRLIPGGVVITPREKLKLDSGDTDMQTVRIGVIGTISPIKGQLFFIEAAIVLLSRVHRPLQFYVIGPQVSGLEWYYNQLIGRCRQAGILPRVTFTGVIEDILLAYRSLDLVVVPSLSEGQSMVVLEAFDQVRAVVATHCGGPDDMIEDGRNGLLVAPGDPEALADALQRLIDDPILRSSLALEGRKTVEQHFDIEQRWSMVGALVDEILEKQVWNSP